MRRSRWERLTSTEVLKLLCLGGLIGLLASRWAGLWVTLPAVTGWQLVARPRQFVKGAMIVTIGVCLGVVRANAILQPLYQSQQFVGQKLVLSGRVIDEPGFVDHGQTEAYIDQVRLSSGLLLPGKVRLRGFTLNLSRGDRVQAEAKLMPGFGGYVAAMYYAKITVLGHDNGWAATLRSRFQTGLLNSLPEPLGPLAFGLLVGARSALPANLNAELAAVGLTHLVAVSGYNLTIIVCAGRRLLTKFTPRTNLLAAGLLIAGFLLLTGFSASIVRATVVAGLGLAAEFYGRPVKPIVLILLAATLTALINPLYIWGDVGWYLSFLAFVGIMVLAPAWSDRLRRPPRLGTEILLESFCAVLLTAPYIMFIFGRLSVVSPAANLLILPLVPLAMLASTVAGLAGMVVARLSGLFAWPAHLLLGAITRVIEWLAGLSWSQRNVSISPSQLVICYLLIGLFYVALRRKQRSNHGILAVIDEE